MGRDTRSQPPAPGESEGIERSLGTYLLREELGRGGMGVVYRARRRDLPRQLAIKVLRSGAGRTAERFAREQEILARLDHPAIVRFLDSGTSADGDPYYVMELVEGLPIDRYCDARQLGLRARIALFLELCDAVSHAHQHFVVHRDLKPSNVLVDREGRPRVLDFGIAKWLDGGEAGQETTRGATPMTLLYASPEQVRGEPVGVGTDVFSLSTLLFELLTGARPHAADLDLFDLAIAIDRQTPPLASAAARERGRAERSRELAGDLDAVLAKGLAKERAERYPSVAALAADLRGYLAYKPVLARGRGRLRQWLYFARRHRGPVAGAALFLLLLSASALVFALQARALTIEKERAEQAKQRAEARVGLLSQVIAEAGPMGSGPLATIDDGLDAVRFEVEKKLAAGEENSSALAATAAEAYWRLGDRSRAAALATVALRSPARLPAREAGMLLAIVVSQAEPLPPGEWEIAAELRRRHLDGGEMTSCELAPALESALAVLASSDLAGSLASEVASDCELGRGALAAAEAALARAARLRGGLPAHHPARRELDVLGAALAARRQELP